MINNATDLVTTRDEMIEGFRWQAARKQQLAEPIIDEIAYFAEKLAQYSQFEDFLNDQITFDFLTAAVSLSQKSVSNLPKEVVNEIIKKQVDFGRLADPHYLRLLTSRYLLSKGDSLGGSMRNEIGRRAQDILGKSILDLLTEENVKFEIERNSGKKVTKIFWEDKAIIFDKKPKFINKSIDIIMVKKNSELDLENPDLYLACGELKGGIDPAGADEHWKTARAALRRIHDCFIKLNKTVPALCFYGAAIENSMADEIFEMLSTGFLKSAANINKTKQFEDGLRYLISLD